jgi:maleate isomerase
VHFGRFRVTEIALNERALAKFDDGPRLEAAGPLADARVKAICWNGTSAGWLGFDTDRALCAAIERRGVAASSSVLSLADTFRCTGVERCGLATPYSDDIQGKILATFRKEGFDCVAERHLGISDNYSFSEVPPDRLTATVREVAEASPQAITIFCTNLRGAPLVENLERDRHSDLRHDRDRSLGSDANRRGRSARDPQLGAVISRGHSSRRIAGRIAASEMRDEARIGVVKHLRLTHDGALMIIEAAVAKAAAMVVPQCIAVVDDGGNLLAFVRIDGSKFLSVDSSIRKAITAVSGRAPTGNEQAEVAIKLAIATSGRYINLKGELPIVLDREVIGAIGVDSGTGNQDVEVATAGIAAIAAAVGTLG